MRMEQVQTAVASIVVLAFVGVVLAMFLLERAVDTTLLLVVLAIVLGAAFYLWDDAMREGVESVEEIQDDSDSGDEGSKDEGSEGEDSKDEGCTSPDRTFVTVPQKGGEEPDSE